MRGGHLAGGNVIETTEEALVVRHDEYRRLLIGREPKTRVRRPGRASTSTWLFARYLFFSRTPRTEIPKCLI